MSEKQVRVGCGALVFRPDGKFLIGKRKGSHGEGTWALPGGHLEFGEDFEVCASRETEEETGLVIPPSKFSYFYATNDPMLEENKHYVTVFVKAELQEPNPEAKIMEPNKCEAWEWVSLEDIKRPDTTFTPLFIPLTHLFQSDRMAF
ncbi:hypothetical protein K7432_006797 [Basidiobolus ranarum]|uniref:Nudix hydrolase domain-containing protein n=1 Tax=Basidiobolus ranarum TaxID=34480 RepID=A0ABR2WUE2_9FUNG